MDTPEKEVRNVSIGIRTTPEVRRGLDKLVDILGRQLGARVSRTQAIEVAIRESLERRENEAQ